MILAPHWRLTQRLTASEALFMPLALLYGALLWRSWTPDTLRLMMPGSLAAGVAGERPTSESSERVRMMMSVRLLHDLVEASIGLFRFP